MKPRIKATAEIISSTIDVPKHFAPQLRRADNFIKMGVAATDRVLPQHANEEKPDERTGLFVGTAFGPMQTNFDVLGLIVDEDQTSPTLFSHSVFNSAAGYIARLFNISGSSFSFTDFSWPFFRALFEGYSAIKSGRLDHCIVLQIESYSDLLIDARSRTAAGPETWPQGAIAWHISAADDAKGRTLEQLEITSNPTSPNAYLHRNEELNIPMGHEICTSPLAAAVAVTSVIQDSDNNQELSCQLTAPYGSVNMSFLPAHH